MKALVMDGIQQLAVCEVPTPRPLDNGAVVRVKANGICRSDWHVWAGDFPVNFPAIIGHELSGVVEETTPGITNFKKGDRVVVPFSGSEGTCEYCRSGNSHLCDSYLYPGTAYSGGYAEYVSVPIADRNMVHIPDEVSFVDAAALGCRFMTAFHGLVDRVQVRPGEWVVVYGCGGGGLSMINIASAMAANVIGVDINPANLELARQMGAHFMVNSRETNPVEAVMEITKGGADVSVDALGIPETCVNGIRSLRKGGRHLQAGVTTKSEAGFISVPIDEMVMREIQFLGTLGMQSHRYSAMLPLVAQGRLTPGKMVNREVSLSEVGQIFEDMTRFANPGIFVVTRFE
jgi:D-arabinose 1-dehydrogenase-like Zn-dependent alcohol dehydrogenase